MLTPSLITAPRPSSLGLRFLSRSPYAKVCFRLPYFFFLLCYSWPVLLSCWCKSTFLLFQPIVSIKTQSCCWHPSLPALIMSSARVDWRWLLSFFSTSKKQFSHQNLEEIEIVWGSSSSKRHMYVLLGNQLQFQVKDTYLNTAKSCSRTETTDGFLIKVNDVGPVCVCTSMLLCRLKNKIEWDNQTLSYSYIYLPLHICWDWTNRSKANLTVKTEYLWTSKLVIGSLLKWKRMENQCLIYYEYRRT